MRRPALRLAMAIVGVMVLLVYVGAAYLGYLGLAFLWSIRPAPVTLVLVLGTAVLVSGYLSYRFGTAQLLAALDTQRLPRERAPGLHARLDRLVERMDVVYPAVYVAYMQVPNALAVGGPARGALVLDRTLFRFLAADELEAIVAHELAHLESHDSLLQTLAYSVGQTAIGLVTLVCLPAVLFVAGVARGWAWIRGRPLSRDSLLDRLHRGFGHAVGLLLFAFTIGVRAHSRRREFAADDRAVEVTGNPIALARALRKIERASDPTWGLFGPLYVGRRDEEERRLYRWLSTHPPMDERVERLLEKADRAGRPREHTASERGVRVPIE